MGFNYTKIDSLANGAALDLGVLTTLAENDRYFARVMPNISYKWKTGNRRSNGGGAYLMTVQSGSVLVPAFSGTKTVSVGLNYTARDNLYVVTTGLRCQDNVPATCTVTGQSNTGFTVTITPINKTAKYSGVFLTWIAVAAIPGEGG